MKIAELTYLEEMFAGMVVEADDYCIITRNSLLRDLNQLCQYAKLALESTDILNPEDIKNRTSEPGNTDATLDKTFNSESENQ